MKRINETKNNKKLMNQIKEMQDQNKTKKEADRNQKVIEI